jgi:exopolysaccharide biosynthesis polyprenyl glycosylphosphotransferase
MRPTTQSHSHKDAGRPALSEARDRAASAAEPPMNGAAPPTGVPAEAAPTASEPPTCDHGESVNGDRRGSAGELVARPANGSAQRNDADVVPHNGHVRPPEVVDRPQVRRLQQLRPVPPHTRAAGTVTTCPPQRSRPVYDPFSARRRRSPEWLIAYVTALVGGDTIAAAVAVNLAIVVPLREPAPTGGLALAFVLTWPPLHMALGSYTERRLGSGTEEFRRVATAGLVAIAMCGLGGALIAAPGLHRLLLVGAPAATLLTLIVHGLGRWRLHEARRMGLKTKQAVLVGRDVAVLDLARRIRRDPAAGLEVVGVFVPRPDEAVDLLRHGISVLGSLDDVVHVLDDVRADTVVVASTSETAGHYLRELAWRLEGTNIELLVSPGVIEVAPNRLSVRPTLSVPLIQIREPEFRGCRRVVKAVVDRVGAAVLIVAAAPLLVAIVVAIRVTGPGPVIYRQHRVGKRGRAFYMLKFRSMVVDAERQVDELMVLNEGNTVLFKLRRDPRVTPVGRFLRRYSLDELPQLINVLKGEMSFVGPRPALEREVAQYGPDMRRRLLVQPGITGLWQVSGRSDLSWAEAVELDVRYVENWSLGLDVAILLRTTRAVLRCPGAY